MNFFKLHGKNIGIDLGTSSILIVLKDKGIIRNEPAIIAIEKKTNNIVAIGQEAKDMIGKTPEKIEALRPLLHGGIANLNAVEMIIEKIISELQETENIGNPRVLINLHVGMTEVEKRAVLKLVLDTGAKEICFVEEPLAAAIGANMDISSPEASMVVDLGCGTTEIAIIALGKIVAYNYLRVAGDDLDEDIIQYIRKKLNVEIGKNTAEYLKIELASVKPVINQNREITGRDLLTGFPKKIKVNAFQLNEAIRDSINKIIEIIRETLDRTPPELLNDVYRKGVMITGGGACIDKIDELIKEKLKIDAVIAEKPMECAALGIHKIMNDDSMMRELKTKRRV